jgi:alpha-galactosidase
MKPSILIKAFLISNLVCLLLACNSSANKEIIKFGKTGIIKFDKDFKLYSIFLDDSIIINHARPEFLYKDSIIDLTGYKNGIIQQSTILDSLGNGMGYCITYHKVNFPIVILRFNVYEKHNFFTTKLSLVKKHLQTNYISPLSEGLLTTNFFRDNVRTLLVPFDNDAWIRYSSIPVDTLKESTSSEVGVVYDDSNKGIVIGSLDHMTWKTGVLTSKGKEGGLRLKAFSGFSDVKLTRDSIVHGMVKNDTIDSPEIFVGIFDDWRQGMEIYAKANRKKETPYIRKWNKGTPIGWNSWGVIQGRLSYENAVGVVDFFADSISGFRISDTAYIDLDSYWDNMVKGGFSGDFQKLREFVFYCKSKKLSPGVYWAPFTDWGFKSGPDRKAEGSDYSFGEMWTKVGNGYFDFDGARALDPTHPGTLKRVDYVINKLKSCGFEMIKIDFLGHAAAESTSFYNKDITTGMQAYRYGMEYLIDAIDNQMLVYAAISPNLATARYVNMRRIACDAFKSIKDTEYSLNGVTYGWWQTYTYDYIDADHVVFGDESLEANKSRLLSAVITGTLLVGDDYSIEGNWSKRAKDFLQNTELLDLVKNGVAFRPFDIDNERGVSRGFSRKIGNYLYVAIFNYDKETTQIDYSVEQLGLDLNKEYDITNILDHTSAQFKNVFHTTLLGEDADLYKIRL